MSEKAIMEWKGAHAPGKECHVLLADDDETTLLVVQQLLKRSGYKGLLSPGLARALDPHALLSSRGLLRPAFN